MYALITSKPRGFNYRDSVTRRWWHDLTLSHVTSPALFRPFHTSMRITWYHIVATQLVSKGYQHFGWRRKKVFSLTTGLHNRTKRSNRFLNINSCKLQSYIMQLGALYFWVKINHNKSRKTISCPNFGSLLIPQFFLFFLPWPWEWERTKSGRVI